MAKINPHEMFKILKKTEKCTKINKFDTNSLQFAKINLREIFQSA